jgi:hypothetical protein
MVEPNSTPTRTKRMNEDFRRLQEILIILDLDGKKTV